MRASCFLVASLAAISTAEAGTRVVLMTDPEDASALQVALAGRGAEISTLPAPEGALRLDRAAVVQRSALDAQAIAGVWIEQEPGSAEVCVVSSDGKLFRHAPLPLDASSPRVFAAIATSLLDEVFAPPPDMPAVNVDVRVDVTAPGGAATVTPPPRSYYMTAPGLTVAAPPSAPDEVVRANRTLVEVGPMLSPLTVGIEAEVAVPITERLRIGAMAGLDYLVFENHDPMLYIGAGELRYVGRGRKHNDFGLVAGYATAQGDGVEFAGVRLERVWEGAGHGVALSLVPLFMIVPDGAVPGLWTSLRWELPL